MLQTDESEQKSFGINFGHLGIIAAAIILLLGVTWMEKPQLFSFKTTASNLADSQDVPHFVPYVAPPQDTQPQVLGANTEDSNGPMIINDDGTVQPVDMGQVLGASTQDVVLSLDDIKVNSVPDSDAAIKTYFDNAKVVESDFLNQTDLASALTSGDQNLINQQAQKLIAVNTALQKLSVPQSLVKLQKLKIIQYNSAISLLQNFTQGDANADLTGTSFQQFMKSQQDLDSENAVVAQKYPNLDPDADIYGVSSGDSSTSVASLLQEAAIATKNLPDISADSNNSDSSDAGQ